MDKKTRNKYLKILAHNIGFNDPELWIKYARDHKFTKVEAVELVKCPDCNDAGSKKIGQYIYYSNLICLLECSRCGLIYSDVHLNSQLITEHFETSYKDENYFTFKRRYIFRQLVSIISKITPNMSSVIDIGGAKGHLLKMLGESRPDLKLVLNDLSKNACECAQKKYFLKTICCSLSNIDFKKVNFDIVLLIDVLYYEKKLTLVWDALSKLDKNSKVIIRVPNKLLFIKACLIFKRFFSEKHILFDSIKYFNPEHLYIFSNKYLRKRLNNIGYSKMQIIPSAFLVESKSESIFFNVLFKTAMFLYYISFRKLILTPSKIIIAQKNNTNMLL